MHQGLFAYEGICIHKGILIYKGMSIYKMDKGMHKVGSSYSSLYKKGGAYVSGVSIHK